ncbi:uncharacterized protein [Aristolochia californica]|uniref:uncharacterized protein n=1 Tax=Aristolochia californica TaxID=171875 RepID=UPI0035E293A8
MGCSDDSNYSKPLPWIGLYVAAASLACALAMATDVFLGLGRRKLLFPCKYFSLIPCKYFSFNASSLTLMAIATKLPVDLNTSMPHWQDQLTKLSGTTFLCTAMANFLPSLGKLREEEMVSNVVALAITVITVIVNIGIQMGTGLLREQYDREYELIPDAPDEAENLAVKTLRQKMKRYWLLAHTCNAEYVHGRSALCGASGVFCLLSAFMLVEAVLRTQLTGMTGFCDGESDYEWSTMIIFVSQVIAIAVGSIAPASRWFNSISFSGSQTGGRCNRTNLRVEKYWVQRLVEWKGSPLPFQMTNRSCRRMAYSVKSQILHFCIQIQKAVVITSKLIRLASPMRSCKTPMLESTSILTTNDYFVVHLDGEDGLVDLIMRKGCEAAELWVDCGREHQPTHFLELLKNYCTASQGFKGVGEFDSEQVQSILSPEPPYCWSLPLVTLVSIAISLPGTDRATIELLLKGVYEGLRYVKLIEKNMDTKGLINMRDGAGSDLERFYHYDRWLIDMREAADIVWEGIDLHDRWFDYDLRKCRHEEQNAEEVIVKLANISKTSVMDFMNQCGRIMNPHDWPAKVIAANSMYRASQTILIEHRSKTEKVEDLFQWLCTTIADIFGACLTNLPHLIYKECIDNRIELREAGVRKAAYLLGETENILEIFEQSGFSGSDTDAMA